MVNPEEFKKKIKETISQGYSIEFLGKNFDYVVNLLSDFKAEKIYLWISEVIKRKIQPISIGSKKPYKEWTINQLLIFRYPFTISNTKYRILFEFGKFCTFSFF